MKFFFFLKQVQCWVWPHREIVFFLRNVYKVLNKSFHDLLYIIFLVTTVKLFWSPDANILIKTRHFQPNVRNKVIKGLWEQFGNSLRFEFPIHFPKHSLKTHLLKLNCLYQPDQSSIKNMHDSTAFPSFKKYNFDICLTSAVQ